MTTAGTSEARMSEATARSSRTIREMRGRGRLVADDASPRDGVRFYLLEDRGVLLDEAAERVYALNESAAVIWCLLEEGLTPTAIAFHLALRSGVRRARAASHVGRIIDEWRELGLLGRTSMVPTPEAHVRLSSPPRPSLIWGLPAAVRHYRLLDVRFRIGFASTDLLERVQPFLAHLAEPTASKGIRTLCLAPDGDLLALVEDGMILERCEAPDEVVPMVKLALTQFALRESQATCAVHAALLRRHGQGLLISGAGGSGKSTLTAALGAAGFAALGDDTVVLDGLGFSARGLALGICLKEGAWTALAGRVPGLGDLAIHRRLDGRMVRYLPLSPDDATADHVAIAWILFPVYRAGAGAVLGEVSPGEALQRLTEGLAPLAERVAAPLVEGLIGWIGRVRCATLVHGDLDAAVDAVDAFCRP